MISKLFRMYHVLKITVFLSRNEVFNPGLKAFFLAVIETLSPKETIVHLKNKPQQTQGLCF